jgi:phosphoribosylamine-glycine ligase
VKKVLILGVSNAQVDAIKYLKEAGWWVIGCSWRHEGRGLELIDQFELIDIKDCAGIEELACKGKIDLIYSVGSDLAMPTVAKVASKLGLPTFVRYETAKLMQHKVLLRDFLTANGISPVKYKKVSSIADLDGWDHCPVVVKPADSQGQRGVFRANSLQEIKLGFERSLEFSRSKTLIIEEFLDGPEISANAFVIDSQVVFNEISDRLIVESYSGGIPRGHVLPTERCFGEMLCETKAQVERCIQALEIENGPVYFQIKLTAKGPRIIEIAPRLDGCHIWRLIKTVGGVDLLDASFKLLTGDKSIDLQMGPCVTRYQLLFFLSSPGKVFREADYAAPSQASYVEYYYKSGEIIRPVNGLMERVGCYIEQRGSVS